MGKIITIGPLLMEVTSSYVYAVDMQLQNPKLRTILRAEQQPAVLYDTSRPGTSTTWMGKLFEVV